MRILQISTNFHPGGIQRHVLDLAEFLSARGHEVTLAGDHGAWAPNSDSGVYFQLDLNKIAASGGSIFKRFLEIVPVARRLRSEIRRSKIQVIHAHETAPLIVAKLATFGLRIPIVFTYYGSDPNRAPSVARTVKRCADWTLSPSRESLDNLVRLGVSADNSRVIGMGIHPLSPVSENMQQMRQRLLGKNGKVLVASLSRLAHQNGIEMMIEVARKIKDKRNDIVIAVGGHGPYEDLVDSWAEVAGVSETIKFMGPVTDVATVLAASDMYLLTSRWEALPVSILEAFRSGLPVIATDCIGVRELVNDSVGTVLEIGNTNAIAARVMELADNPQLRKALGNNAIELSQQDRFLPQTVHENYERFYREICTT